jgi:hypothetical protein
MYCHMSLSYPFVLLGAVCFNLRKLVTEEIVKNVSSKVKPKILNPR